MEILFTATKKDFRVDTYRGTGPGGQHRNKTDSCVRITHIETGLAASACDSRSQTQNKREAFRKLADLIMIKVTKEFGNAGCDGNSNKLSLVVRTYHEVDNRVKDHLSGLQRPYKEVLDDPTEMIESRAEAARADS